jgi:hypothetical protein
MRLLLVEDDTMIAEVVLDLLRAWSGFGAGTSRCTNPLDDGIRLDSPSEVRPSSCHSSDWCRCLRTEPG